MHQLQQFKYLLVQQVPFGVRMRASLDENPFDIQVSSRGRDVLLFRRFRTAVQVLVDLDCDDGAADPHRTSWQYSLPGPGGVLPSLSISVPCITISVRITSCAEMGCRRVNVSITLNPVCTQ